MKEKILVCENLEIFYKNNKQNFPQWGEIKLLPDENSHSKVQ